MKKVILKIGGMSCSACSNGLEKYLNKQNGIFGASVNLIMNNASIEYDETILKLDDIEKLVYNAGFESLGIDDFKSNKKKEKKKKIELIILGVLSILLMYISMGHMIGLYVPEIINMELNPKIYSSVLFALTIPSLVIGFDIFSSGYKNLVHLMPNMDTLVSLGVISSFLYSLFSLVMVFLEKDYVHQLYFESCTMIIFFIKLGRYIDSITKNKTTEAIQDLMRLTPSFARVIKNGKEKKVTIDEIEKGDIVVCRSGESIAVDGLIIKGETTINEALITGESIPNAKKVGERVIAGSINGDGYIEYQAERIGKESTVSEIVRMVVEATNTKAPIARIADTVSKYFVQVIMIVALLGFIVWMIIKRDFAYSLNTFVTVLVIACPCALGLATPIALVVSNGKSAKNGILIKNNEVLENFSKTNVIVFDKTGTLTEGKLVLQKEKYYNLERKDVLKISGSVEKKSNHPIANAILEVCEKEKIDYIDVEEFENIPGKGIKAKVGNDVVYIGNQRLMDEYNISYVEVEKDIKEVVDEGNTLLIVSINNNIEAIFGARDKVKENIKEVVSSLKSKNIEVLMLTGDNEKIANNIAKDCGIEKVISNVLPNEKAKIIKDLKEDGKIVAMVGDGINDAPSLTIADIGISISSATDIAVNSASIVLMQDDLNKIIKFFEISKKTMKIIKENLFWAFFYNACMIPIALGVLSGLSIFINPMLASVAMMFSSLSVVLNALRLR